MRLPVPAVKTPVSALLLSGSIPAASIVFSYVAPSFFAGTIEFGKITQASAAFITPRISLSLVIDQFGASAASTPP